MSYPINHDEMIKRAIAQSAKALTEPARYVPFGAVIVNNTTGEIVSEECNDTPEKMDPTLHGEVVAIRKACEKTGSLTLENCTLYTSFLPCSFCCALIWFVRIPRVYYAQDGSNTKDIFDLEPLAEDMRKPVTERVYKVIQASPERVAESEKVLRDWAAMCPDSAIFKRYDSTGQPLPMVKTD